MARDLSAKEGDTLKITWYAPDSMNNLAEQDGVFVIKKITDITGIWADSLLMPDFPGIAGTESCSEWDAGVPIKMNKIRPVDEEYWKQFRGTPKAFISYEKGKELWGNNFGPATSLRYQHGTTPEDISRSLKGHLDPYRTGFAIYDLKRESVDAANNSVDFSTLFIGLGFFLILASVVLLTLVLTTYLNTKQVQTRLYHALGFKNRWIEKLVLLESSVIAITGCFTGSFTGYLVNILIIRALNSVWTGAVQTSTLESFFSLIPIFAGFIITSAITLIVILLKIKQYFRKLNKLKTVIIHDRQDRKYFRFSVFTFIAALTLLLLSFLLNNYQIALCFLAGVLVFVAQLFFWRYKFTKLNVGGQNLKKDINIQRRYYSANPSLVPGTCSVYSGRYICSLYYRGEQDECHQQAECSIFRYWWLSALVRSIYSCIGRP